MTDKGKTTVESNLGSVFNGTNVVRKYGLIFAGWSMLVAASLAWNLHLVERKALDNAAIEARASLSRDIAFREWATSHGGVYVPPTPTTPPNPYLKVPDRDVVTTTGKSLTLMNPAYMIRELHNQFADKMGVRTHLTSLKLMNPNNAPDEWEIRALNNFEQGKREMLDVSLIEGKPHLRLMLAFTVKKGCLNCHAQQGYKVGDVRGGISTIVPLEPYLFAERDQSNGLILSHAGIWLFGLLTMAIVFIFEKRTIIQRKQAEISLLRLNRALKTLSACNLVLVRATIEDELIREVVRVITQQGGYSLAAVLYAKDDTQQSITLMCSSAFDKKPYRVDRLSWGDNEQGQLPVSRAIRSGTTQICHDIAADPSFDPWRELIQARGYQANIGLPLSEDGKTFGALSIYASDANAFDDEEVRLLEELANDLTYGITTLRTRREHEQHTVILRESLEQSIQTIAYTVEARDPYTAGHQRRVAELATAIAQEMGLPEVQIRGIHLAAIIHDLGKIHVPAEILSKPGKLSAIEYQLIQMHPQEGYNILKNVKFPWPIAQMVLQHHERMDGSGYPQGLKGDAILLEARILCVSDVVEAMSSHRPYRPGLGINAALDEIKASRGTLYGSAVVDACLKVFGEGKFEFQK